MENDWKCSDCGSPCKAVKESFDYSGTHCTHGRSGTHYTGRLISDCCGADVEEAVNEVDLNEIREILSGEISQLNLANATEWELYLIANRLKISCTSSDHVLILRRFLKECSYGQHD